MLSCLLRYTLRFQVSAVYQPCCCIRKRLARLKECPLWISEIRNVNYINLVTLAPVFIYKQTLQGQRWNKHRYFPFLHQPKTQLIYYWHFANKIRQHLNRLKNLNFGVKFPLVQGPCIAFGHKEPIRGRAHNMWTLRPLHPSKVFSLSTYVTTLFNGWNQVEHTAISKITMKRKALSYRSKKYPYLLINWTELN